MHIMMTSCGHASCLQELIFILEMKDISELQKIILKQFMIGLGQINMEEVLFGVKMQIKHLKMHVSMAQEQ